MMKEKLVVKSVRFLVSASHRRSGSLYTTLPVAYCMGYRVRSITVPLKDASSSIRNDWSSSLKLVKLKESELTRGITITANEREGIEFHRHRLDGRIVHGAVAVEAEEGTPRVGDRKKARPSAYDDSLTESMMKEKLVVKSVRFLVSASHRRSGSLYTTLPVAYCMGYRVRLITVPLKDASASLWNDRSSSLKLGKLKESELTRGITIAANERWMTTENKLHLCCAMAGRSQMNTANASAVQVGVSLSFNHLAPEDGGCSLE
ncbi:hypothetical protein C4D60_Mb09t21570 [Musa balbisiana]|uniref:Uncharacterized protein n=1 Tax=Musa balbisiana TaxID=52838 RepID=A0A4S8II19_MUSBA|nr:hypothetical protein C4D60_Mb09t21570 [Musa balbisiana]